jgi:hypothetical protein
MIPYHRHKYGEIKAHNNAHLEFSRMRVAEAPLNPLQPKRVAIDNPGEYRCPKDRKHKSAHIQAGCAPRKDERKKGAAPIEQDSKAKSFLVWEYHATMFLGPTNQVGHSRRRLRHDEAEE